MTDDESGTSSLAALAGTLAAAAAEKVELDLSLDVNVEFDP